MKQEQKSRIIMSMATSSMIRIRFICPIHCNNPNYGNNYKTKKWEQIRESIRVLLWMITCLIFVFLLTIINSDKFYRFITLFNMSSF